jgi:hypothetical protein
LRRADGPVFLFEFVVDGHRSGGALRRGHHDEAAAFGRVSGEVEAGDAGALVFVRPDLAVVFEAAAEVRVEVASRAGVTPEEDGVAGFGGTV